MWLPPYQRTQSHLNRWLVGQLPLTVKAARRAVGKKNKSQGWGGGSGASTKPNWSFWQTEEWRKSLFCPCGGPSGSHEAWGTNNTPPHTLPISPRLSVKTPNLSSLRERCSHGKTQRLLLFGLFLNTGFGSEFFFFFWFRSISVKCKSQSQQWEDKSKTVRGMKARLRPTPLHKFLEKNTCFAPTCPEIAGCTCERLPTKWVFCLFLADLWPSELIAKTLQVRPEEEGEGGPLTKLFSWE